MDELYKKLIDEMIQQIYFFRFPERDQVLFPPSSEENLNTWRSDALKQYNNDPYFHMLVRTSVERIFFLFNEKWKTYQDYLDGLLV